MGKRIIILAALNISKIIINIAVLGVIIDGDLPVGIHFLSSFLNDRMIST